MNARIQQSMVSLLRTSLIQHDEEEEEEEEALEEGQEGTSQEEVFEAHLDDVKLVSN